MRLSSLILCAFAAGLSGAEPASPPPGNPGSAIPVEDFFAEPDLSDVQISPDGRNLAFLSVLQTGRVGIGLMDLATGKIEPLVAAKDEDYAFFLWKGSDCLVFGGDLGGNESLSLRSIRLSQRRIIGLAESFRERYTERANWAAIVDSLRFDPNHVLIYGNKDSGSSSVRYYRLDVRSGERTTEPYESDGGEAGVTFDNTGTARVRVRYSGAKALFEQRTRTGLFTPVKEFPAADIGWEAVAFAADNETLYLLTHDTTDTTALRIFDLRTAQASPVLFNSPDGDIDQVILSWDRSQLYGVRYFTDQPHYHWFDAARAQLQAQIDAALPGTFNEVVSTTPDEQLLAIHAWSDRAPGAFYLLDRRRGVLMLIGQARARLEPTQMRPMEPIVYQARDGLTICGYLTRPAAASSRPAPLILVPHGGPYGIRDKWEFNPAVQFLANRGYAVLQVNYRGSGGYGQRFLNAGKHEWGRKMQDDLTDAVRWAIGQGIADPRHVAIFGASYGGYAALAGVTFTPELYCCAVNYVGVSDLAILNRFSHAPGAGPGTKIFFTEWVDNEPASLRARSPVNFVEAIRVPTLHAYGENDPRVDIDHWKRLKAQLDKYQKPYEFLRLDTEGHGFRKQENRIRFYRAVEAFFAANLRDHGTEVKAQATEVHEPPVATAK